MKIKLVLIFFSTILFCDSLKAQFVIENGGFELWTNDTLPSRPVYWDTFDHLVEEVLGSSGVQAGWCTKDTTPANVFAGAASCKLKTEYAPMVGITAGTVIYGRFGFNGQPDYTGNPFSGQVPHAFSGSWKYEPHGIDTATYQVLFYRYDPVRQSDSVVLGPGHYITGNSGGFVSFTHVITYPSNLVPDSVFIVFSSSYSYDGNFDTLQIGSTLWVDNLSFSYCLPIDSNITASICSGSSYQFNGLSLTSAGTYIDTLSNSIGCDSIITLWLTVNSPDTGVSNISICTGSSYFFNGQTLSETGTYYETLTSFTGCDSIHILNLQVVDQITNQINASICQGAPYSFMGRNLDSAGTYTDTMTAVGGCDSIITLRLMIDTLPNVTFVISHDTVCSDASAIILTGGSPAGGNYSGTGVTDSLFSAVSAGIGPALITYKYIDSIGCSDSASATIVVDLCTGINNERGLISSITLYPNPVENELTVQCYLKNSGFTAVIYDITGKLVNVPVMRHSQFQITFNTANLAMGIYWLKVNADGATTSEKFVKSE